MNFAALTTLVAVVTKGSFAAAAQEVGCTPSAVSLQMKHLEAYFGRALFDRSTRSVRPTPFARELAAEAAEMIERMRGLRSRPSLTVSGRIRLGAIQSVQLAVLPMALRALRDEHPELAVTLSGWSDTDVLLQDLKAGKLDAAIVVRPDSNRGRRLVWLDLYRQEFVLVASAGTTGSAEELIRNSRWVGYDTSLTGGKLASQYVRRIAPQARPEMSLRSIEAIIAMVSEGLGISVVPRPRQSQTDAYGVRVIGLGRRGPVRQISLVHRRADLDDRNIKAVHATLTEVVARWMVPAEAGRGPAPRVR